MGSPKRPTTSTLPRPGSGSTKPGTKTSPRNNNLGSRTLDRSLGERSASGSSRSNGLPDPRATRPTSPTRSYGNGPRGRGNLGGRSLEGREPTKINAPGSQPSTRPRPGTGSSNPRPSNPSARPTNPTARPSRGGLPKSGTGERLSDPRGVRGVAPRGGPAPRPSTPGGSTSSGGSSYAGGSSVRPSSYWGGSSSYNYAPYHYNYTPYYTNYIHCSPWSFGYYGSRFSFSFGGWFYPYGFYYRSYRGFGRSYWSPFDYSYCLPSYSPVIYVVQSYEPAVSDSLPASSAVYVAPEEPISEPVAAAPAPKPLDTAADRYLTLGDTAFREERYTDAVQLYAKAVEYAPEEASLYLVLADALFASGDYHYAAYVIRKGLELDPSLASADVDKHDFYANPVVLDQQLAVLEAYLLRHPSDRDARLVLALNFLFAKRPAAAVDLLEAPEASGLAEDQAAALVLQAARQQQHGPRAD